MAKLTFTKVTPIKKFKNLNNLSADVSKMVSKSIAASVKKAKAPKASKTKKTIVKESISKLYRK